MKLIAKPLKKRSQKSNTDILDEITRSFGKVSIDTNASNTTADDILSEWKIHIKENDVLYYIHLTNEFAKGRLLSSATTQSLQLDDEFYYLLGKYASPPIYTILKNSEFLDSFTKVCIQRQMHLQILEGIASNDNHQLFDHLVCMNEFIRITYSDIHQYTLSLLENKAHNTMTSLIQTISRYGEQQLKHEFISKVKVNMSRVIEQYDSRMIAIILRGIQQLT
jgi:hypothetical protein